MKGRARCSVPDLHDFALLLGRVRPRRLPAHLEADVSRLLEIQQLLEELLHVVVGLGARLHETDAPGLRLALALGRRHLPELGRFVALVPDEHHRNLTQVRSFQLLYQLESTKTNYSRRKRE